MMVNSDQVLLRVCVVVDLLAVYHVLYSPMPLDIIKACLLIQTMSIYVMICNLYQDFRTLSEVATSSLVFFFIGGIMFIVGSIIEDILCLMICKRV